MRKVFQTFAFFLVPALALAQPSPFVGPTQPAPRQPQGALTGVIIYTNAGHGWTADDDDSYRRDGDRGWFTQRARLNGMVEDYGNLEQLNLFASYAWNAGATVVPFRPVGWQPREVVLDTTDPGVEVRGQWREGTGEIFYGPADTGVGYLEHPAIATPGSVVPLVRFRPDLPEAGEYPVYVWTPAGPNRGPQRYRVVHSGGMFEAVVDHSRVGNGWVWLGTHHFEKGTGGYVDVLSAVPEDAESSGVMIAADAVRFGVGMGDVDRGGGVSGRTRDLEASRYWVERSLAANAPQDILDLVGFRDMDDNVGAPARMAAHMNREEVGNYYDRIYLSFHSNAGRPNTLGLYNNSFFLEGQREFAKRIADELVYDLEELDEGTTLAVDFVTTRTGGIYGFNYGEIRSAYNNGEMTATIIEVASHEDPRDAIVLRDPPARAAAARASLHAIIGFLAEQGTIEEHYPPERPWGLRTRLSEDNELLLRWQPPLPDPAGAGRPEGFVLYESRNGYGFGEPRTLDNPGDPQFFMPFDPSVGPRWYRVASVNKGGESLFTEVVGVHRGEKAGRVLIVNAFDRFDEGLKPMEVVEENFGSTRGRGGEFARLLPHRMNSFDYAVPHGQALAAAGYGFDTASNEAVTSGMVALADYDAVIWAAGEDGEAGEPALTPENLRQLEEYLAQGGALLLSGSEWAYGLHSQEDGAGQRFLERVLRVQFEGTDAGVMSVSGAADTAFAGLETIAFGVEDGAPYEVDGADKLRALESARVVLPLDTLLGGLGVGVEVEKAGGAGRAVLLGFPFEAIGDEAQRAAVMEAAIGFLIGE